MKSAIRLIVIPVIVSIVISCGGNKSGKYLQHCSTSIMHDDPISVTIRDGMSFDAVLCADAAAVKREIRLSPSFDYDVSLSPDASVLFIKPVKPLKYGARYVVKGNFGVLAGKERGMESFAVQVLYPKTDLVWGPLVRDDEGLPAEVQGYRVDMTLTSADPLDAAYLEKNVRRPSAVGNVKWQHSEDGLVHKAVFGPIKAGNADRKVTMALSCEDYGIHSERSVTVPKAREFCVTDVTLIQEPYHYDIAFSDNLEKDQDFSSLVSMPGAGHLTFVLSGNVLSVSPSNRVDERQELHVSSDIRNDRSAPMKEAYDDCFPLPPVEPYIRFISNGVILPSASGLNVHFESSKYRKARVRCYRIFENNVLQFLQNNSLNDANTYIRNVSRMILDTTFTLASDDDRISSAHTYGINLSEMVKVQKGAIYKIEIGGVEPTADVAVDSFDAEYMLGSWRTYADRARNILVSDLGIIVKGSTDGEYTFVVTDLLSASPKAGAAVTVYNDVNQQIASGKTDHDGRFVCKIKGDYPGTAVASFGGDKSYIRLNAGGALSLSNFDVAGNASKEGCKAFIFGERGVWRPGDDIHLCFMAVPDKGTLPAGHPVTASLYNPQGQLISTYTSNEGHDGMYSFVFGTKPDAPTGRWMAEFSLGGQSWSKPVRIETVKPNNLLIDLKFDSSIPDASSITGTLTAKSLVGNPAAGLQARIEAEIHSTAPVFKQYGGYTFMDDSRMRQSQEVELFTGVTSEEGALRFNAAVNAAQSPGMLKASVTTRVFEKSGDFSTSVTPLTISPYGRYVGMKIPMERNEWGEEFLDIRRTQVMSVIAVDPEGNSCKDDVEVLVEMFKTGWNWWWTSSPSEIAEYARDRFVTPYKSFKTTVTSGKASVDLVFDRSSSGYYFIRVSDRKGGHSTAMPVLVCRPDEGSVSGDSNSAICLPISSDKESYKVGENAKLTIPSAAGSRAFVSLEKGGTVLRTFWTSCGEGSSVLEIPLTAEMTPNVYASVTLVQPYNSTLNDAPIRLFGVKRLMVEDAATHVNPVIEVASEARPESRMNVRIRERDGRPMSFVLAVVDEGLLNLTGFRTPDPWKSFFATEALGVHTWDLYNSVIGAYGARMEQLFSVGGDGEADGALSPETKVQRFPPVSIVEGPFTIGRGGSRSVAIDIPRYIGNVRVMAIATDGRNVGSSSANVSVTKPVMVKMTLPRLVGTDDEILVPVTVMATRDNIGDVSVKLESSGGLSASGARSATVNMTSAGEKIAYFRMKASSESGTAAVKAVCECGGETSTDEVEIAVREANTLLTTSETFVLPGGASRSVDLQLAGRPGTNSVKAEASTIPSIDLGFRMDYLLSYPHGCLEQTVSAAFPQLYLPSVTSLSPEEKKNCTENIQHALSSLPSFGIPSGGFTTWRGTSDYAGANVWASIYATHFILEASKAGYSIPANLRASALRFVGDVASDNGNRSLGDRAYACYVLALAGKPDRSAMSRLREKLGSMDEEQILLLSSAYASGVSKDAARDIYKNGTGSGNGYSHSDRSYSSEERIMALGVMLNTALGDEAAAFNLVRKLAARLNDRNVYMSTQTSSWALLAVADYAVRCGVKGGLDVSVVSGTAKYALSGDKAVVSTTVPAAKSSSMHFEVSNGSGAEAYVVLSSKGYAARGQEVKTSNGLEIKVEYRLPDGSPVDPSSLERGTDFTCITSVTNKGVMDCPDIALSQLFPCGWEIRCDRADTEDLYQDWRDDRVYSYFNLGKGETVKTTIRLVASYAGKYYHPAFTAEAMYDGLVNAVVPGFEVTVR